MTVTWSTNGYCALSGGELKAFEELDQMFVSMAADVSADPHRFPDLIAKSDLNRINYFDSFGHLATCVEHGEHALTPAACYHVYSMLKDREFGSPQYLTTRANCFRRETHYEPLRRQWCFGMREIVCVGTAQNCVEFLQHYRSKLTEFFAAQSMPVKFEIATDPFFDPENNPKWIMQRVDPVKYEMVYNDELAIGSLNNHRTTFGDAFNIRINGKPAYSACVAFGLERWLYATGARVWI